jgi:hypothetical protein
MINWIKGIFDKNSNVSSKRFVGVVLVLWALLISSYYIIKVQFDGVESSTTISIIEFSIVTGASLLAGGTIAENIKLNKD